MKKATALSDPERAKRVEGESKGFSILEVILAAALFVTFSVGAITVVVSGYNANRLGAEFSVANQFASEGMEAVKSIKNQSYCDLAAVSSSTRGLLRTGGVWAFDADGTDDRLTHNSSDDFIRTVKVERVRRNAAGDIVISGGTVDSYSKKITSTVNWNFNTARPESISLVSYLSDWRRPIPGGSNGIIIYTGEGSNTPTYRIYDVCSNSFGPEFSTVAGGLGKNFVTRTSPTKGEVIVGYGDNSNPQILRVMCFDGATWSIEWSATVGGDGSGTNATTRRFDIAYETNSGDVLVVYSTNSGTNEIGYKTKPGSADCGASNWVSYPNIDSPGTSGTVTWVTMAWDRRSTSNLIAAVWADTANDLQGAVWDGDTNSWVQRTTAMDTSLALGSIQDVEFESVSGDIMVVWANVAGNNGTNGARYMTCVGGTANCTWDASAQTPPTFLDAAQNLDIAANPLDNQLLFASIGFDPNDSGGQDLQVGRWDGSAWANVANVDTSSKPPLGAVSKMVANGWLIAGSTVRGIVVYVDNVTTGVISYLVMTPCGPPYPCSPSWSGLQTASPAPTMGGNQLWNDIQMDPINQESLILTASNFTNDLFAKRLVMTAGPTLTWTDANNGSVLELDLGQNSRSPFSFAYWRY
ncbi:hypothetical protein HYS94_00725 [Candidatus Daviesbacteria bacterium]|nr:hypothetical protein [Candidatus Daviesbacteria bacterium]